MTDPDTTLKILYITPEKLSKSEVIQGKFRECFSKGLLSKFFFNFKFLTF